MGAGFNVDKGGNHRINGRREFNWWWDPEAVRMVMSAPWKKITITPVDISVKTSLSQDMQGSDRQVRAPRPRSTSRSIRVRVRAAADTCGTRLRPPPSSIRRSSPNSRSCRSTSTSTMAPSYGQTIFMEKTVKAPSWLWKVSTVQVDLDKDKFYKLYVDLMSRPSKKP